MNTAPSDRAAELRAKLLAIRSASGTTPVPELNTNKDVRLNEADTTGVASHGRFKADMKAEPNPSSKEAILTRKSDLVQKGTPEKLLDRRNSETDIEGLFAEARAAVEAEKTPASEHLRKVHGVGKRNTLPSKKVRESSPGAERRSSLNDSVDSFGTSEQGEIHDNHVHLGKARPLKQVEISRKSDGPAKEVEIERQRQPVVVTGNSMRQQKYVDTDLANSHGDRPSPDSARVRPGSTSSRTASADHQTQPKASMQRSKEDHLTHAERSYRPDREIYVSPQDSERERERKAAEYKRELESRRQRSGDARITADRDVEDSRRPRQTNPSTPKDPDARLHAKETQVARAHPMEDIEDLEDWLQMTGYYDRSYRQKALDRNRKLMALDAQRAELEREAQLEYEERAQIARAQSVLPQESIEGDIARVGISPRSLRTSSVITMPPPPVPIKRSSDNVGLRIKDLATRENVASGRRLEEDLHTSTQIETMSPIERSTLKRHHNPEDREPEGLRPVAKIARMDMNGRLTSHVDVRPSSLPVRASPVSLDERITKDNNSWTRDHHRDFAHGEVDVDRHSRVTRGRPGSPYRDMNRQRLRSLSPIPRRTNGYDTYATGRRMSDEIMTDRSGRSPRQPIVSREPSPVRRAYDSRDAYQSLAYTELRDNHPPRNVYEKNLKPEPVSHALSEYQDYIPSRSAYEHHQYTSTGGRGRGRGRGGYFSTRGGYKSYRGGEEQCSDNAGSQALDLRAGGQF